MTSLQTAEEHAAEVDLDRLKGLVADVLAEAKQHGATSAEAAVTASVGLTASVRLGEVDTIEHVRDRGLALTVYHGQQRGSASTNDLRWQAVRETVAAACAIARFTSEDPHAGLADAELMPTAIPNLDLRHPWRLETAEAIELALSIESAARQRDPRITNSEGATVAHSDSQHVYGNTHGFIGHYARTRHSLSCAVIAEDAAGMQRDHWYSVARDPTALESPEGVGAKAAERALRRLGARQLSTRQVPVVFVAQIAAGLFSHLVNAIRGANLYRKASFLWDHLGKRIFSDFVHIHEQPHLSKGLGSTPFDQEGVATRARDIVADGVLQGYVLSSYSARKLGMQTTGNAGGVHNLTIDPGAIDLADLLREMDTGLLVTELMGMGINLVTGDYSRGASGFWVSRGEIQFPVQEITIAGNLREMFQGIQAIASDVDSRTNVRTGSVLIARMTVAGE
ncbi:MAG: metalloprotease PmbA [Gammaproteobacteria bacterium]